MKREEVIDLLAEKIIQLKRNHPIRVGIDGITASGKTTFANDLVNCLLQKGANAIRISLDGFHNPKKIRYQKGRTCPKGYYFDAYNYSEIVEHLLMPLESSTNNLIRTQTLNLNTDERELSEQFEIPKGSIVVVDGSFSLRKELYDFWDMRLYLKVDFSCAEKRAGERDGVFFGSKDLAIETTRNRYHQAHRIHNELEKPWEKADYVVDNNDPCNPYLQKR